MPSACARSMIACESASSVFQPKFIVPRQRRETDRPLRPRCVYSMGNHPGTLASVPQNDELSAFDAATAVRRAEGGGLIADLDPGWDVGGGVLNGGYLLAVAARAAVLESPHPHPVALAASYLRATSAGPATLHVTPGSAGRTLAHAHVVLADAGGPCLTVQTTTAALDSGEVAWSSPPAEIGSGGEWRPSAGPAGGQAELLGGG